MWTLVLHLLFAFAFALEPIPLSERAELDVSGEVQVQGGALQTARPDGSPVSTVQLRALAGAGLRFTPFVRVSVALGTTFTGGQSPPPGATVPFYLPEALITLGNGQLWQLHLGRSPWKLGDGLLVDPGELAPMPRAFDGLRLFLTPGRTTLQLLGGAEVGPSAQHGPLGWTGRSLFGAWMDHGLGPHQWSAYYLGNHDPRVPTTEGTTSELRHTAGGAWQHTGALTARTEAMVQWGQRQGMRLFAWGAAGQLEARLAERLRPTFLLAAGASSGHQGGDTLTVFRAPFPTPRHLGATTRLGPQNSMGTNAGVRLHPHPSVVVELNARALWRTSLQDSLYDMAGQPYPAPGLGRFTGTGQSLFAAWFPSPHLTLSVFVDAFQPAQGPSVWLATTTMAVRL